jgi:hypothetical protein
LTYQKFNAKRDEKHQDDKSGVVNGNNGIGNGIDPQPPGDPKVNDGEPKEPKAK